MSETTFALNLEPKLGYTMRMKIFLVCLGLWIGASWSEASPAKSEAIAPAPKVPAPTAKVAAPTTPAPATQATPIPAKPAASTTQAAPKPAVNITVKPATTSSNRVSDSQKEFCNLVWNCNLPEPKGFCPDKSLVPKPSFTYDSARCLEARNLNARGIGPGHPTFGFRLYRFLGMEYRVIFNVEDSLPISDARMTYLLADLPLAAHLIRNFQKEPYTAEYVDADHKHFQGTKGKHLRGDASLISGTTEERRLFYFGYGIADVAFWTLRGPALMDFTYFPSPTNPKLLKYKMKLLVFPGNGFVNGIMNLGVFRNVVLSKIKEVLIDITQTAQKLALAGSKDILASPDWTAEEKKKIEEFLKLP